MLYSVHGSYGLSDHMDGPDFLLNLSFQGRASISFFGEARKRQPGAERWNVYCFPGMFGAMLYKCKLWHM